MKIYHYDIKKENKVNINQIRIIKNNNIVGYKKVDERNYERTLCEKDNQRISYFCHVRYIINNMPFMPWKYNYTCALKVHCVLKLIVVHYYV